MVHYNRYLCYTVVITVIDFLMYVMHLHDKITYTAFHYTNFDCQGGNAVEWLQPFNQAINYIEENLSATISYEHAAQIACCSTYHFQRMFSAIRIYPPQTYDGGSI